MRVYIYWNIRRKCFSVKALAGPNRGRVIAHVTHFEVADATFNVNEASRQRVIATGRKNVHAGIVGMLVASGNETSTHPGYVTAGEVVKYNPHKWATFVRWFDLPTVTPVLRASRVWGDGKWGQASIAAQGMS